MPSNLSEALLSGMHDAFVCVQDTATAFSALRNGGAESYLRALSVDGIEKATGYVAFLEANKKRVDAVLRCPKSGESKAALEFKHNFLPQTTEIESSRSKAKKQLLHHEDVNIEKYYVHFVIALESKDLECGLAEFHNRYVSTNYKKFYTPDQQVKYLDKVEKGFGHPPAGRYEFAKHQDLRAVLLFWINRLEGEEFQPLGIK
jgi:hypothetical protein